MRRERSGRTLQTTALVHEAYLRLLKDASLSLESRAHFLGVAAHAMREILIEHARARVAQKRGGGAVRVTFDESVSPSPDVRLTCSRSTRRCSGWPASMSAMPASSNSGISAACRLKKRPQRSTCLRPRSNVPGRWPGRGCFGSWAGPRQQDAGPEPTMTELPTNALPASRSCSSRASAARRRNGRLPRSGLRGRARSPGRCRGASRGRRPRAGLPSPGAGVGALLLDDGPRPCGPAPWWAPTGLSASWAPAAWARCISRTTRVLAGRSR